METKDKIESAVIESLNWRYATKQMNGEKIPVDKLFRILESIRLSATSMGLQPFKVLVIEDEVVRAKLSPAVYNQPQILQASQVLVFAAIDPITDEYVNSFMELVASERNVPVSSLEGFKGMITNTIEPRTNEENFNWAARQTYIALGTALLTAAMEQIDATPMEGFSPAMVDEALGLRERGLRSTVIMALGYRNEETDNLALAPKVRRSSEELFIKI
jgi:nitroreductase